MLKSFINLKEMLDFLEPMSRKLINICISVIIRVINRNGNNLFIPCAAVFHNENANRKTLNNSHRLNFLTAQNKNVKRVVIACIGTRNKSVICRIMSRRKKNTVKLKHTCFFIEFVLILAAF